MSKVRDEAKAAGNAVKPQQQQQQQQRAQRTSSRQNHQATDGNQLSVFDAVADLRFADDFAEYVARAEGGGSTYGLLRRHAFAQTSLRIRRPTTHDDDEVDNTRLAVSRQRRSRSLVPSPRRRSGEQTSPSLPNHKTLLQALCAQTQQQQQQRKRDKRIDTLQVRAHTSAKLRRRTGDAD